MKHQHLPPAIGFGPFHELQRDVPESIELLVVHEPADQLVVLLGVGMEAVWTFGIVGVAMIGAGDECDSQSRRGGRRRDHRAGLDVVRRR